VAFMMIGDTACSFERRPRSGRPAGLSGLASADSQKACGIGMRPLFIFRLFMRSAAEGEWRPSYWLPTSTPKNEGGVTPMIGMGLVPSSADFFRPRDTGVTAISPLPECVKLRTATGGKHCGDVRPRGR